MVYVRNSLQNAADPFGKLRLRVRQVSSYLQLQDVVEAEEAPDEKTEIFQTSKNNKKEKNKYNTATHNIAHIVQ